VKRLPGSVLTRLSVVLMGGALWVWISVVGLRPGDEASLTPSETSAVPTADTSIDAGPRAAGLMVDRVQLFRTGNAGYEMALSGAEMTALLRHAAPGLVPAGVSNPAVVLSKNEVRVTARVSREVFPVSFHLPVLANVLPDTLEVELRGRFVRLGADGVAFRVEQALAERLPLPRAVVSSVVAAFPGGLPDGVRLPGSGGRLDGVPAVRMPWPGGIGSIQVRDGELILRRPERILDRTVDGSGSP